MLSIGVISQKGGVGKSTTARLIAVNSALAELDTKIIDLDIQQGTCTAWNSRRMQNNIAPHISVEQFPTVKAAIKKSSGYDLVIFDGSPHATKQTLEVSKVANLVVIPSGTSLDDLEPSILLCHELKSKGVNRDKIYILLSKVGASEVELNEAKEYLQRSGYNHFENYIPEKTAIRRALDSGRCANETDYKSVNEKVQKAVDEIADKIGEMV